MNLNKFLLTLFCSHLALASFGQISHEFKTDLVSWIDTSPNLYYEMRKNALGVEIGGNLIFDEAPFSVRMLVSDTCVVSPMENERTAFEPTITLKKYIRTPDKTQISNVYFGLISRNRFYFNNENPNGFNPPNILGLGLTFGGKVHVKKIIIEPFYQIVFDISNNFQGSRDIADFTGIGLRLGFTTRQHPNLPESNYIPQHEFKTNIFDWYSLAPNLYYEYRKNKIGLEAGFLFEKSNLVLNVPTNFDHEGVACNNLIFYYDRNMVEFSLAFKRYLWNKKSSKLSNLYLGLINENCFQLTENQDYRDDYVRTNQSEPFYYVAEYGLGLVTGYKFYIADKIVMEPQVALLFQYRQYNRENELFINSIPMHIDLGFRVGLIRGKSIR